jgi:hypothetical protein
MFKSNRVAYTGGQQLWLIKIGHLQDFIVTFLPSCIHVLDSI